MLRGQLDVLGAGRGSVVLVAGPAGAGKTMLLAEAANLAADRGSGFSAVTGNSAARAVPLGVILDALVSAEDPPVDPGRLHDLSQSPTSGPGCCASCWKPSRKPHTAPRCWS